MAELEKKKEDETVELTDELQYLFEFVNGGLTFAEYQKKLEESRKRQEETLKRCGLLEEDF